MARPSVSEKRLRRRESLLVIRIAEGKLELVEIATAKRVLERLTSDEDDAAMTAEYGQPE